MARRLDQLAVDAHDPRSPARLWAAVLDHRILDEADDGVIIGADEHAYPGLPSASRSCRCPSPGCPSDDAGR